MPKKQVVYTVHKFKAENEDEISINVGEQVIVLGKDEGFHDGWWQGRNVRGEVGLFPITYTAKQPPSVTASIALESKIDSLSRIKAPASTINPQQQKKMTSSVYSMSSISTKNIHSTVNQSLENPLFNSKVEEWTSNQVSTWLISIGFDKQLADNFKDQEITGDILLELTLSSLKELDVATFGKRFKVHNAINALRQEAKKQKLCTATPTATPTANKNIQARVASPFRDISNHNDALLSYYDNNKQQQPYPDDDLVSDYSTVIRNSQLPQPKFMPQTNTIPISSIASSPRLSSLVERHHNDRQNHQQQPQPQRPISHQAVSTSIDTDTGSTVLKRSTMSNIKAQELSLEGRSSTSSRYSFMRSSFVPPSNKLQTVLSTHTLHVGGSEDTHSLSEASVSPPDMEGWLYKQGDRYKTWNKRWFVLKENNLFYFKNQKAMRMKGIINLKGYRIEVDESIQPGKYCFMAHHARERTFYFYTEFEKPMKDWLKALMKATIARDFATPVMSSSTIPTISLEMARRMRPRPPSTIFLAQNDPPRASPPSLYHDGMYQHFSSMSLNERAQPITQIPPSVLMNSRPVEQKRVLSESASEYLVDQHNSRLKDSGFNSTHGGVGLTSSAIESSRSSYGCCSISIGAINASEFCLDEEDEDVIDPERMSVIESKRGTDAADKEKDRFSSVEFAVVHKQDGTATTKLGYYIDWINTHIQGRIKSLSDLSSGDDLLEFLESLTSKQVLKPSVMPGQTLISQRMDRIISAFKFMSLEGVEMDGACTIRDVLNGNEIKIMHMLDAVENWSKSESGKKMASGGTFGEDDQCRLRELEEVSENMLPPHSFASR